MDINDIAYEKYKLDWMMSHGYTLVDLAAQIRDVQEVNPNINAIGALFEWENDLGFDGEIWACYDEFMDSEFLDKEYMAMILGCDEYKKYLEYVEKEMKVY